LRLPAGRQAALSFVFIYHYNIFLRANGDAIAATFTEIVITDKSIFFLAADAAFRANHKAHLASDAIFLQEFRFDCCAPGTGL